MFLKVDEETKRVIEEISALSGIQRDVVREVWEFTLINWIEKITRDPAKLTTLTVPHLGQVGVKYVNDVLNETDGTIDTQVEAYLSLSPAFRTLVGDIFDEKRNVIIDILQSKIDTALSTVTEQ